MTERQRVVLFALLDNLTDINLVSDSDILLLVMKCGALILEYPVEVLLLELLVLGFVHLKPRRIILFLLLQAFELVSVFVDKLQLLLRLLTR